MRGRKAKSIERIDQYDFDKLSKTQGNARERRRYLAFAHIQEGKSFTEAALAARITLRALMKWIQKFRKDGINGLKDQPGRGQPALLSLDQRESFKQAVLELQQNKIGGSIKGLDVLELMEKKFGIKPCLNTVYNTLKSINLVWISGRSIHPKTDLAAQEDFKKNLKKK
jgi:transposase